MQSFWNWLIGEAGAGWIFGLLGIALLLYSGLKREKPPRVIVQEVRRLRLLDIHPSQKDRLEVYYTTALGGREAVPNLAQRQIVVYNSGTTDILEEIRLELQISTPGSSQEENPHALMESIFDAPASSGLIYNGQDAGPVTGVYITIPYLNSFPVHKHYVTGYLISDQNLDLELLSGTGKGWSARFVSLRKAREIWRRLSSILQKVVSALLASCLLTIVPLFFLVGSDYVRIRVNPAPSDVQLCAENCRENYERLLTLPLLARFTRSPDEVLLALGMVQLFLASAILFVRQYLIGWIITWRLGIQPPRKFGIDD
jgi:hypothetical protein